MANGAYIHKNNNLILLDNNALKPFCVKFRLQNQKSTYDSMKEKLKLEMKEVASNIRKVREFRNYTQDYLAAKLEISQNAYSKIELGYSKITLDRLFHIALILEVQVMELLYFDKNNFTSKLGTSA